MNNTPDPIIAWNVILTIGITLSIAMNAVALVRGGKRQVTIIPDAVRKEDFDKHVAEDIRVHEQLFSNISSKERGLRDESSRQLLALRGELSTTNSMMHELKGEMKQLSSQLVIMQNQLNKPHGN